MQKILSLGQKQFLSGVSPSSHLEDSGVFVKGMRLNPFVDPFPESTQTGILQTSADPTDLTGSVVLDTILAGASRVTGALSGNLYMIGSGGNFYSEDLNTEGTPTALRTGAGSTIANAANGIEIFQPSGGTEYMYYFTKTTIGRWDLTSSHPSGWTDEWSSSLTNTEHHPVHFFNGALFFGNGDTLGKIYNVSGSASTSYAELSFPADFLTTCLDDDGDYLVIGITKNKGDNIIAADTRVLFWDTLSQNFNKEWSIPDFSINALAKFENGLIAFCGRGIYYFNSVTKPVKIKNLSTANAVGYGYPHAADVLNDAVIWGGGLGTDGYLSTYGKIIPETSRSYFQPFGGITGAQSFVESNTKVNRIYVGTSQPKFYSYTLSSSGGTTTTVPETIYFDLKTEWHIKKIEFLLAEPLASGDSVTVQYQTDADTSAATFGTLSFTNYGAVKRAELFLDGGVITTQIKLLLNFTAGNVKIKQIEIYGDPIIRTEL